MRFKFFSMGKNIAAAFFIFFSGLSLGAALAAFSALPDFKSKAVLNGAWMKEFESSFSRSLPVYTPSKNLWGRVVVAREGVVIGEDGWLYTREEFETSRESETLYQNNLAFIKDVSRQFEGSGVRLFIAVLPSKARVTNSLLLPESKKNVAARFINDMRSSGIQALELQNIEYFKTDTHWTAKGAESAARQIAGMLEHGTEAFKNKLAGSKDFEGDLQRFISLDLPPERLDIYELETPKEADLFSDKEIPVVLVGTSYSAKRDFNFENFLKEHLQSDILNMAEQGQGPFNVMAAYLEEKTYDPKIVIWEIPERYLTLHLE